MLKPHMTASAADLLTVAMMHHTVYYCIIAKDSEWVEVREIRLKDAKSIFACFFLVQTHYILI